MVDLYGRPLRFRKKFPVEDPVRQHIAVEEWRTVRPLVGTCQPFVLTFAKPLDWALLFHAISIKSTQGTPVDGRVSIGNCERTWSFTPTLPWAAENYHVRVAPGLEDVCGNSVIAPFDRPLRRGGDLTIESEDGSLSFCPI